MRAQLRSLLEGAGFFVLEAEDGDLGVKAASQNPDLAIIIADYSMPRMDGLTMLEHIRQMPAHANVPVFVLTTESNPALKAAGRQLRVTVWVVKPVDDESLLGAIERVLADFAKAPA